MRRCAAVMVLGLIGVARAAGPDVIIGDLPAVQRWTASPIDGRQAYSFANTWCNVGDTRAGWHQSTNQHPVFAQNMYRLRDGRFEQIGMAWLPHQFFALSGSGCLTCNDPTSGSELGVACSTPDSANYNGGQPNMGPRSEINAFTGAFSFPYLLGHNQSGDGIYKRLQVDDSEVDISAGGNGAALYFIEGAAVAPDDAAAGNGLNNYSYRRVTVDSARNVSAAGSTQRMSPAVTAWRDHGLGVDTPDPDVQLTPIDVPGEGRFWLAARATDLGGGVFHYEYAIENINSDRSGGSFSVPVDAAAHVSSIGFHGVPYHSGEPYDNTDWQHALAGGAVTWTPAPFAPVKNSNALRWGTLCNFRFDADRAPTTGPVTLGLFKTVAGQPASVTVQSIVPAAPGCACSGDLNGSLTVDGDDIEPFVHMAAGMMPVSNCADLASPPGGPLDAADVAAFAARLVDGDPCE